MGWWASCLVERLALGWSQGLYTAPFFTLAICTVDVELGVNDECSFFCYLHYTAVGVWALSELPALYYRHCPPVLLAAVFVGGVSFATAYFVANFAFGSPNDFGRKAAGTLQLASMFSVRVIPALLPFKNGPGEESVPLNVLS